VQWGVFRHCRPPLLYAAASALLISHATNRSLRYTIPSKLQIPGAGGPVIARSMVKVQGGHRSQGLAFSCSTGSASALAAGGVLGEWTTALDKMGDNARRYALRTSRSIG
jgi:hypothetical protein